MATIKLLRLGNGNIRAELLGNTKTVPGDGWTVDDSGTRIIISKPGEKTIEIETSGNTVEDLDGVIAGTAAEIAEVLSTTTFFKAGGSNIPENMAVTDADNNFTSDQTINGTVYSKGSSAGFGFNKRGTSSLGGIWYADGTSVYLLSGFTGHNVIQFINDRLIFPQGVPEYTDNAAAVSAGLANGTPYRTGDTLKIVHA